MTNTPGDDDMDWSFLEELEVPQDVENVQTLELPDLLAKYEEITDQLRIRQEMLRPTTDIGRGLHSKRAALRIELTRRNIM